MVVSCFIILFIHLVCIDGSADAAPADHTSTVDVNEHHQNGTFEDADHDIIEDYSVDKDLEQAEK